jgi:N-acetylglucosamine-6-phosphate deacetylase
MARIIADVMLVSPGTHIRPVCIALGDDGLIETIHEGHHPPAGASVQFDGGGEVRVMPGFIDIHTHGANGADLSQGTLEALNTIAEAKLKEGVTTFLPTTWTASPEQTLDMARAAAAYRAAPRFARVPGLHVEGPFLNPKQAGAQDISEMRPPDLAEVLKIDQICPVLLLSLALEMPGARDLIADLEPREIVTSAAHSAATFEEFRRARRVGLGHLTHYGNQMSPLHHREIGLVGAGLLDTGVLVEIICDRVHLCDAMIQLVYRHIGCDRLMLITDSIAASHLGDGIYPLHGTSLIVKDGAARIPEGNLAGSIVTFDLALRNAAAITGLPLNELSKTSSGNQARSLRLKDRGEIKQGWLADLTLLTPELHVVATYVGGDMLYGAQ